jgi:hypothetical protein
VSKRRFNLTLEPVGPTDDAGAVRQLRSALKTLLRRHGLRCVRVEQADQREPNPDGEYSYPLESAEPTAISKWPKWDTESHESTHRIQPAGPASSQSAETPAEVLVTG